jgi:tetratricopeptide (TPR) repeat protein
LIFAKPLAGKNFENAYLLNGKDLTYLNSMSSKKRQKSIKNLELAAQKAVNEENFNEALKIYDTILSSKDLSKKKKSKYYCEVGNIYNLQKYYDLSIMYYKEALYLYPKDLKIQVNIAQIYLKNNLYALAEDLFKEILESDKKNKPAKIGLGGIYFYQQNYPKAVFYYEQILPDGGEDIVLKLSICYRNMRNFDKALDILNDFIEKDNANGNIFFLAGLLFMDKNESAKAEENFLKSLRYDGSHIFQVYLYLARIYEFKNDLKSSQKYLKKALALDSSYAITDLMLAKNFYKLKDINSAKKSASAATRKTSSPFLKSHAQKLLNFLDNGKV